MKQARRFVAGLVAGFLLAALLYGLLFYLNLGSPTESSRWCFEINQMKSRAAADITAPKLLLVGGSGTLFGIRAAEIQEQSGWPTVNLGTHAVLGTSYILRQAQKLARPGDVVLLTFEYELYRAGRLDPSLADQGFVDYVLARDPAYFRELNLADKWTFFMLASTQRLQKGLRTLIRGERDATYGGVYDPAFLNACGDQTHNASSARQPHSLSKILGQTCDLASGLSAHPAGFEPIATFCHWAETNHIRVLATYPNLCDKSAYHQPPAEQAAAQILGFFSQLKVPVLGDYTNSLLPPDSFFDTFYHLTQEAALDRTRKLLPELQRYLGQPGKSSACAVKPEPKRNGVGQNGNGVSQ